MPPPEALGLEDPGGTEQQLREEERPLLLRREPSTGRVAVVPRSSVREEHRLVAALQPEDLKS